jgi:cytochrome bd ubiquinol oxidase subunit II
MSLAALIAIGVGFALTAYAIFAGADFGAGILDLSFGKSPEQRVALARTIGPLWEANHVWLIFSITILFSAFPTGFAALGTVLLAPFTLALIAIVVRGVAFGLRPDAGGHARSDRLLGRAFGAASVAAPLLFGASAAAVAQVSSSSRASATPRSVPWTGLFAGLVGLLAVALCAHLAASFMTNRIEQTAQPGLAERFRRRGLQTGASVLALSLLALLAAAWKAPDLWHRLTGPALPMLAIGLLATVVSLYAFARRRYLLARAATMLTTGAIIWGWLIAQSPRVSGPRLTIHTAAATGPALTALTIAGAVVLITVLPCLLSALCPLCPPITGDNRMKLSPPRMKLSPPMKLSALGLDRLNLAAGALMLWVALSPWIWGYASSGSAVASHVFFIFAFGPLTLLLVVLRPAAFVVSVAGLWLAVSPWLLGYATNHSAWLSELATGVLLSIVGAHAAAINLPTLVHRRGQRRPHATASRPAEAAGSRS